jgi:hypothetical protein
LVARLIHLGSFSRSQVSALLCCLVCRAPYPTAQLPSFTKSFGGYQSFTHSLSPSLPLVFFSAQHSFNRLGTLPFFHSFLPLLPASIAIAVPVPRHSSTWFEPARRSNAQTSRDGQPHSELAQRFPPLSRGLLMPADSSCCSRTLPQFRGFEAWPCWCHCASSRALLTPVVVLHHQLLPQPATTDTRLCTAD